MPSRRGRKGRGLQKSKSFDKGGTLIDAIFKRRHRAKNVKKAYLICPGEGKEKKDSLTEFVFPESGESIRGSRDANDFFTVFRDSKSKDFAFVAKEILEDTLGLRGYRTLIRKYSDKEFTFKKKIGKGKNMLCITSPGLSQLFAVTKADKRKETIQYLNDNYDVVFSMSRDRDVYPRKRKEKRLAVKNSTNSIMAMNERILKKFQEELSSIDNKLETIKDIIVRDLADASVRALNSQSEK